MTAVVTSFRNDTSSNVVFTTSEDSYVALFDVAVQTVVQRARPPSCTCGDGVMNTVLEAVSGLPGRRPCRESETP